MTIRDDLVAQVLQALKDVLLNGTPPSPSDRDYTDLANAAVDAVAVYIYVALASAEEQSGWRKGEQ